MAIIETIELGFKSSLHHLVQHILVRAELCQIVVGSIIAILTFWYIVKNKKPENFPPGPRGVPVLGVLPFLCGKKAEDKFLVSELKIMYVYVC